MFCSKPFCKLSLEEGFVSCWLCNVVFHAKCVDLSPRTADNLREDKGVRWCCIKCKVFDIKFFSFVKNNIAEVENISQDLLLITEKFKNYKELIENASCLNKLMESPESKRKKTSKNKNNNSADNNPILPSSKESVRANPPQANAISIRPVVPSILDIAPSGSDHLLNPALAIYHPQSNSTSVRSPIPSTVDNTPSGSGHHFSSMNSPIIQKSLETIPNPFITPKPLKVVPSNRTIFAARFTAETTEDDVAYYIKSKLGNDIDLRVIKFTYTERRSTSSFKIVVPEDVFDVMINPDFWPAKSIIREYIYKDKVRSDIASFPARPSDSSKN